MGMSEATCSSARPNCELNPALKQLMTEEVSEIADGLRITEEQIRTGQALSLTEQWVVAHACGYTRRQPGGHSAWQSHTRGPAPAAGLPGGGRRVNGSRYASLTRPVRLGGGGLRV